MISIIVPIYNVGKYLDDCIQSVLRQTYTDYELILIDDGSTDDCGKICDSYAHLPNIIVVHNTNHGISHARNTGLDLAKGEYICFLDSDDTIAENYLEELLQTLLKHDADIAICNFADTATDGSELPGARTYTLPDALTRHEACRALFSSDFVIYTLVWNKIYKRVLFDSIRFPEGHKHEDDAIIYRLLYAAEKIVCTPATLYFYRMTPTGTIHDPSKKISNSKDRLHVYHERFLFFLEQKEKELSVLAFHRYMTQCISTVSLLIRKDKADSKQILRAGKKVHDAHIGKISVSAKHRLYYRLFFLFPGLIIRLRNLKHKATRNA